MSKPTISQVEIVIFGPGYGESIVLHIGGRWIVIDSCKYQGAAVPAPLAYLIDRGVDVEMDVDWVIATHWHDDHIRGIGYVFEACKSAKFGCPNALA